MTCIEEHLPGESGLTEGRCVQVQTPTGKYTVFLSVQHVPAHFTIKASKRFSVSPLMH